MDKIHRVAKIMAIAAPAVMATIANRLNPAGGLFPVDLEVGSEEVGTTDDDD